MAINNYTALATAIASWLDVGTADISSVVSDLVVNGEKRIMREVRTPAQEVALSSQITAGGISVPADYIEMKYAYVDGNPTQLLMMVPPAYIYDQYPTRSAQGIPKVIARDGANFIFGPYPDSDYTIKGAYYAHLTLTQVGATAHTLFTSNPDLYLFGCLAEAEPIIGRDARIPIWEQKYQMVKNLVNGEADRSRHGGNLSIRPA